MKLDMDSFRDNVLLASRRIKLPAFRDGEVHLVRTFCDGAFSYPGICDVTFARISRALWATLDRLEEPGEFLMK
jgi:hypothetical protein